MGAARIARAAGARLATAIAVVSALACAACGASGDAGARRGPAAPAQGATTEERGAPPHDLDGHDDGCRAHEPPTTYACHFDSECGVCHDGSSCGTIMSAAEIARRGAACTQHDSAECEYSAPRCCDGRCVRASM